MATGYRSSWWSIVVRWRARRRSATLGPGEDLSVEDAEPAVLIADPGTERLKEPIRTLARHPRWDRKTWFGTRLVPLGTGTICVGDAVKPEEGTD
jgi:hypothetical protein